MSEHRGTARTSSNGAEAQVSRRVFLRRMAVVGGLLTGGAGLAAACGPAAPASPAVPASKPAESSKPASAAKPAAPGASEAPKAAAPAAGKPQPSGSVVLVLPEEARTMSNWEAYSSTGYPVLRNVEEALINRDPKTNKLVGELATKWERTEPATWRFELRKGVKFHDGSPFNAEAAAFGINWTWSKENAFEMRAFIGPEMNAKAVDEYTLDVTTEQPDPILPSRLYFSPIPSMKLLKETPDQYPLRAVGTGPYRFVEWNRGQFIKIEVNPDWWGHSATAEAHGAATIKEATFMARPEREVRAAMVKTGEADLARWLTAEQCKTLEKCASGPGIETVFLRLDTQHPALADIRVREAIGLAVDKQTILQDLIGGGTPARQLVGPSALGYNPDLQPVPFDPNRAKQLIAEAKAAGVDIEAPLTVYGRSGYVVRVTEITEAVAEMLRQVGLPNVKVQLLEQAKFQDLFASKPIPPERGMIAVHMHGNEMMDFAATVSSYYACSGKNATLCDSEVDELHQKALPLTGAEREKAYQAVAARIAQLKHTVPIGHPDFFFGVSQRLQWEPRMDGFLLLKEMALKS